MVGYALSRSSKRPAWLDPLLSEKFFTTCEEHAANFKKTEKNIFCIDCGLGICQHCVRHHASHRLLQIRRYVYNDVIRLHDIQKLLDCGRVQTYIINSAKVVFLNERPQSKPSKGAGNVCKSCDRSLQDAYRYCSVACKVKTAFGTSYNVRRVNLAHSSCTSMEGKYHSRYDKAASAPNEMVEEEESSLMVKAFEMCGNGRDNNHSSNRARYHHRLCTSAINSTPLLSSPSTSSGSITNEDFSWDSNCSPSPSPSPSPPNLNNLPRFDFINSRSTGQLDISLRSVILLPNANYNPSINRRKGKPQRSPIC